MSTQPDFELALARFDLIPWLKRRGFKGQGRKQKEFLHSCFLCGGEDKLSVNPEKRMWRCLRCNAPMTLLDVIQAWEGSYQRAIQVVLHEQLARANTLERIGDSLEDVKTTVSTRPRNWKPAPIEPPPHFLPLTAHIAYTLKRNFDLTNLLAAGVGSCTGGRYQDRLVFPVRRYPDGAWLYFQGRALWEREHNGAGTYLKNLNPAADDVHASASDVLLGLEFVEAQRIKHVGLVEGPTDYIQNRGCVALFGKNISDRQIQLLVDAGVTDVDVMLDPDAYDPPTRRDAEGRVVPIDKPSSAQVVIERLSLAFRVWRVMFPRGFDTGDYDVQTNEHWRATRELVGNGSRLAKLS